MEDNTASHIIAFVIKQLVLLAEQCELILSYEHDDHVTLSYLYALLAVTKTALTLALKENAIDGEIFSKMAERFIVAGSNRSLSRQQFFKHQEHLYSHVELISKRIIKWHNGTKDNSLACSIEAAGCALFEMLFRRQYRREIMNKKVYVLSEQVRLHCEVMQESFHRAMLMGGTRIEQARNALEIALFMKSTIFNTAPKLVLVHDLDNNLTFDDSYYSEFPNWNLFLKAKEVHDKYKISPWEARFSALSIFGTLHSDTRESFLLLLRDLGSKISRVVFEDVKGLLQGVNHFSGQEGRIECCIVTASNSIMASEVSAGLGWFPNRVWGVNERNCDGFDKALTLLEILCDDPNIILVCSDDGDSGLIQDLKEESLLHNSNISVPLPYLCFFAARCAAEGESTQYRLYEALNSKKFPFLLNCAERIPSGKLYGYQGVTEYIRIYKEWISKR